MLGWLFASNAERRLLPGGRFNGPTPWVIAIMTFAMLIVAAAGLALSNAANVVAAGIEGRFVVELPGGGRALPQALSAVRSTPGVSHAEPVPESEMRRTLERWLGPTAANADLPIPALINFDLSSSSPADVLAIERKVQAIAPDARISPHSESVAPLLRAMRALQWLSLTLVLLMTLATSATVVLAARGALDTNRSTIDIMHGIGATDLQVTHLFQRKIALDAALGAIAGGLVAGAALLSLTAGTAVLAGDLAGLSPIRENDLLLLGALPLAIVGLATWVARVAVLRAMRESI